jgi:hypothetical protein
VRPAGNPNPRTILSPRQAINSAPYAIQTVNATQLGGLIAIRYVSSDTNGNVGIGTASPATKLDVVNSTSQLRFGPSTATAAATDLATAIREPATIRESATIQGTPTTRATETIRAAAARRATTTAAVRPCSSPTTW